MVARISVKRLMVAWALMLAHGLLAAESLPQIIPKIKPSVVAVGTHLPTRRPPAAVLGTGFVVGDGRSIATNAHVLPDALDLEHREHLAIFQRRGDGIRMWRATRQALDERHDLALLRIEGGPLPPLGLASRPAREGALYAFTGFPVGSVLGLYPVTHRGIVSAVTPIAVPVGGSRELDPAMIARLRDPYPVLQLDATAYPGNSGSPLYRPEDGRVVGILNMVFVKESKESVLEKPSGIAYAIPVTHLRALLESGR